MYFQKEGKTFIAFCLLLLLATFLRFNSLAHKKITTDEGHYRGDMGNILQYLKQGKFRDHSVHHQKGAPHGLVAPGVAYVVGKSAYFVTRPLLPKSDYYRQNLLSRLAYALVSVGLVALVFVFGSALFDKSIGLCLMGLAATSPHLINWGQVEYMDGFLALFALLAFTLLWINPRQWTLAGAAFCLAAALGTKWTALFIIPFVWIAYGWLRGAQSNHRWHSADLIALMKFAGLTILLSFIFHSWDSFHWALFPEPGWRFDDTAGSPLSWTREIWAFNTAHDQGLSQALFWFAPFAVGALYLGWGAWAQWKVGRVRDGFLVWMLISALVSVRMIPTPMASWRATYLLLTLLICSGYWLEKIPYRPRMIGCAMLILASLPFAILDGLRMRPSPVAYYGTNTGYFDSEDPLPPERIIFPK